VAAAAALFVAAVSFVKPLEPSAPPELPMLGPKAVARAAEIATAAPLADSGAMERAILARFDSAPIARVLRQRNGEPDVAGRIAGAIMRESARLRIEPSLLTAMLVTENPHLDPGTVSSQGAIGLMQVMHFHAGTFDCGSEDLWQIESNICHGASVFGRYLKRTGDVRRALLRYNGCVVSANTPNCHYYPTKVLREAGKIRRQFLLYPAGYRRSTPN
jgi:soluble lytic murein transglycosylase-like protein